MKNNFDFRFVKRNTMQPSSESGYVLQAIQTLDFLEGFLLCCILKQFAYGKFTICGFFPVRKIFFCISHPGGANPTANKF